MRLGFFGVPAAVQLYSAPNLLNTDLKHNRTTTPLGSTSDSILGPSENGMCTSLEFDRIFSGRIKSTSCKTFWMDMRPALVTSRSFGLTLCCSDDKREGTRVRVSFALIDMRTSCVLSTMHSTRGNASAENASPRRRAHWEVSASGLRPTRCLWTSAGRTQGSTRETHCWVRFRIYGQA